MQHASLLHILAVAAVIGHENDRRILSYALIIQIVKYIPKTLVYTLDHRSVARLPLVHAGLEILLDETVVPLDRRMGAVVRHI